MSTGFARTTSEAPGKSVSDSGILSHPSICVLAVAVATSIVLRRVFLYSAEWLWHFAAVVRLSDLTPWARSSMNNRDGAEPYGLLAVVALQWLLTAAGCLALGRIGPRFRALVVACLLGGDVLFAWWVPLRPPMALVNRNLRSALMVVIASLAVGLLLKRAIRVRSRVPGLVLVLLIPVCLVPTTLPSLEDIISVLAPALRLHHGFSVAEVYLQYDLLPSLLALGWSNLGGAPLSFTFVTGISFYLLTLGLFVLSRRTFRHGDLSAPLLVCVVLVRIYAVMVDANSVPQATPMRLDLWVLLLWVAYARGLRSWAVGLLLGALCFFSRSMGTLYLGAYALAIATDFLAVRHNVPRFSRLPLLIDLQRLVVSIAPAIALVGLSVVCIRLVFGSFGSDAVNIYRHFGIGMLRMTADSFYWWVLALTGATGWLAFWRRGSVPERYGQVAIFAVALMVSNSIYFFGRSHEHNLINISASILFCLFLGLDMAAPSVEESVPAIRAAFRFVPWLVVAVCAYFYSERVSDKMAVQKAVIVDQRSLPPALPQDTMPAIHCDEITRAAGDGRVYLFSKYDYWYYTRCDFVPQGYIQPFNLAVLKSPLVAELNQTLARGFKIVLPRQRGDWNMFFAEFLSALGNPDMTETANYRIYRRHITAQNY